MVGRDGAAAPDAAAAAAVGMVGRVPVWLMEHTHVASVQTRLVVFVFDTRDRDREHHDDPSSASSRLHVVVGFWTRKSNSKVIGVQTDEC